MLELCADFYFNSTFFAKTVHLLQEQARGQSVLPLLRKMM